MASPPQLPFPSILRGAAHFVRRCAAAFAAFLCTSCASRRAFCDIGNEVSYITKTVRIKRTVNIYNNPLIVRLLAQVGTFHICGVAAASQILCISTALNKRKLTLFCLQYDTLLAYSEKVNIHFIKTVSDQLTFSLNFWISFSLDTFSITPPRLRSFSSKRSYPLWI